MSYVSILKNIPEFLSQPAGIAAIASVGIHGAIAFILPLMPVDDSKPKQKEETASVGIMELSQAEQSRLPQTKRPLISGLPKVPLQPGITLPNFAVQPTPLTQLPPSADSTKVILPPLPKSGKNPNISPLPRSGSLPILPKPNFNSSFNAKAQSSASFRRNYNPRINLGSSAPLVARRSTPARIPSVPRNVPPIQSAPVPDFANIPAPPALPPMGNPGISSGNSVAINSQVNQAIKNGAVNQPRRVRPEDFVAPTNRNIPKPGDKLTFAGQNVQQWGQQPSGNRRILLPKQPSQNVTTTTAPQNNQISPKNPSKLALARQFEEVKQKYPNLETKEPISEVVKPTKKGREGKVEGTLVIDSDGKADYLKFADRSVSSKLKKETRNYFRDYFKKNPIRKNGKAKVYAFALDFKSDAVKTVEFSKPQDKLVNRLRDTKDEPAQKKPENISRSSAPVKIDVQPSPGAVVVPTQTAPAKIKPQVQIRTKKPASASQNNDQKPAEVRLRNTQEVPKVPSKPKPQARVNVKEPAPQATSKPSLANRLRNIKEESEDDSKKTSDSKNLIERLRKIQERRENSN